MTIADMPYDYLEEFGTADIAFEATGRDLAELFRDAADATTNVMIDNIEAIQPRETRQIELSNDKLDMLLFDLLQELIFLKTPSVCCCACENCKSKRKMKTIL